MTLRSLSAGKKHVLMFFLLFGLVFVRYCYYGFEYYYQLDDYIQHHNYYARYGGLLRAISELGLLAARPLAGIADVMIWTRFFPVMIAAVAIISAMFAASALIFRQVLSRRFGTGYVFLVVYTLLPLGIEGTYWVSASSRIVSGLFFASLSLYFFDRWCAAGKKRFLIIYALAQALCYGFYEQALVFSVTATLLAA